MGTILGSAEKIPSTSVYISHLSAFIADAKATADVSEPPLPKVVVSPDSETPWNPATIITSLLSNCSKIRNLNAYSKSYINHLITSNEILASMILTLNNIVFYQDLMNRIRNSIKNNAFDTFYNKYINVI